MKSICDDNNFDYIFKLVFDKQIELVSMQKS